MKEFLKDYFFSFFNHKRAKNIYKRSFIITFLNVIILFFALFLSSFLTQEISFKYHYNNCPELHDVLASVLPDGEIINNEKLSIDKTYNSFKEDSNKYLDKGFHVIIDTREAKTTFDDFSFTMTNSSSESISYEQYLSLEESEKEKYTPIITREGVYLDTVSKIPTYESYLSTLENQNEYKELKTKYENGEISQLAYANSIYVLYGKSYYPEDVYNCDTYGGLPTLRSYYLALINKEGPEQNFIFLYEEGMECNFNSNGKHVSFFGTFSHINKLDLSTDKDSKIDSLIFSSYKNTASLRAVGYLFINFFTWFLFVLVFVVSVFITRLVLSMVHKDQHHYTLKIMNLMGSFVLFSSLIGFIFGLFSGFYLSNQATVFITPIIILIATIIRTIIYYLMEKHPSDYIADEQ